MPPLYGAQARSCSAGKTFPRLQAGVEVSETLPPPFPPPQTPPQPRFQAGPSLQPQEFAALKVGAERGRLLRGSSRDPGESPGFAGGLTRCGVPCLTAEPGRRPNRAFVLLTDDLLSFRMRARRPECSRCPGDGMRRLPDAVSERISLECCDHPSGVLIGLGGGWGALGTAREELEQGHPGEGAELRQGCGMCWEKPLPVGRNIPEWFLGPVWCQGVISLFRWG